MDTATIQTYDAMAREYEAETADFWERFPSDFIEEFSGMVKGGQVLDVGSGPGRDGVLLRNAGCDVVCIDASQSMVELCASKGLTAIQGDLLQLPFGAGSFDGVWAYTSLLHIKKDQMPKALAEIQRVLKPGGTLGLGLIEGNGEEYRTSSGVDRPRWFAFYQKEDIERLIEGAGFRVRHFIQFRPRSKVYLNYIAERI